MSQGLEKLPFNFNDSNLLIIYLTDNLMCIILPCLQGGGV